MSSIVRKPPRWRSHLAMVAMIFLIRYRQTVMGPLWLIIGPSLFIGLLGLLYAEVSSIPPSVFVPHLAIGLILWTLMQGFVNGGATVFQRGRSQLMQGAQSLDDIVAIEVTTVVFTFLHQIPIIIAVFLFLKIGLSWVALESLVGLAIIAVNGIWLVYVCGIIGARYRDLSEILQAIMRIAFLATPIIWMPGHSVQSGIVGAFLILNPFYHFIEIVRAPLLGKDVAMTTWAIVLAITVMGGALSYWVRKRYARFVPLWI